MCNISSGVRCWQWGVEEGPSRWIQSGAVVGGAFAATRWDAATVQAPSAGRSVPLLGLLQGAQARQPTRYALYPNAVARYLNTDWTERGVHFPARRHRDKTGCTSTWSMESRDEWAECTYVEVVESHQWPLINLKSCYDFLFYIWFTGFSKCFHTHMQAHICKSPICTKQKQTFDCFSICVFAIWHFLYWS